MATSAAPLNLSDPETIAELEGQLKGRLHDCEAAKWQRALQWFDNYAYLLGNHTTRFFYSATNGFTMFRFAAEGEEDQFTRAVAQTADNYLIPATEAAVALLTNPDHEPRILPDAQNPREEDASAVGQAICRAVSQSPLQMRELKPEAALIAAICDEVVAETELGETQALIEVAKTRSRRRKNPLREYDPAAPETEVVEEVSGTETLPVEDIQVKLWTSFHFDRDPTATSNRTARWFARSTYEHVDWVIDNFARDEAGFVYKAAQADQLKGEIQEKGDCFLSPLYWWDRVRDIIPSPPSDSLGMTAQIERHRGYSTDQTLFTIFDERPTKAAPRGRTYIMAGGKLVYAGDARAWVSPTGPSGEVRTSRWHPYSFFTWFKTPGRPSGAALLSQLLPLQKRINAIDAAIAANRSYMAFGQWFIPRGSNVGLGRISGLWGEQYLYDELATNAKPERVPQPVLPNYLWEERMGCVKSIDRIAASGIVPGEQISPSATRAAAILNTTQRQKLEAKAPTLLRWESFLESIFANILIEYQERLNEGDVSTYVRVHSMASELSPVAVEAFRQTPMIDGHAVRIDLVNQALTSPEAEKENAIQYLQSVMAGSGPTPAERNMVLRTLGLDKHMMNPVDSSINRMRRTLSRVKDGTLRDVIMLPGEDATVQLPLIVDMILSDDFQMDVLPQETKAVILAYYDAYQALAAQQENARLQQQMMLMQMQAGGTPAAS